MTIKAWRVVQQPFADTAFSGDGARLYGGRWNRPGTPIVYCAESLALATLEILVNLDFGQALARYVSIPVDFDEDLCETISRKMLPPDWSSDPLPMSTQQLGSRWVTSGTSVVLAVPSVVVASETNYLINPMHPDFARIKLGRATPLKVDPRLLD